MSTTGQLLHTLPITQFRRARKAAFLVALALLGGFISTTAQASNKAVPAASAGRAHVLRGPATRGASAGLHKGKAGGKVVRHWKRVKVHGKYVLVPDEAPAPEDNPLANFLVAVLTGDPSGLMDSGDMEVGDADLGEDSAAWVAFARAHHLRRGPRGYVWPRGKGPLPQRFALKVAAIRSAQIRSVGGGGGRSKR